MPQNKLTVKSLLNAAGPVQGLELTGLGQDETGCKGLFIHRTERRAPAWRTSRSSPMRNWTLTTRSGTSPPAPRSGCGGPGRITRQGPEMGDPRNVPWRSSAPRRKTIPCRRNAIPMSSCARLPTCARAPTSTAPCSASVPGWPRPCTASSRHAASTGSTPPSSPAPTARAPGNCSG